MSCFKDGKLFWLVWLEESRAEVSDLEVHNQIPATEGAIEAIFLLPYFVGLTFVTHTEVVYRGLRFCCFTLSQGFLGSCTFKYFLKLLKEHIQSSTFERA